MASDAAGQRELRFLHVADLGWDRALPVDPHMPPDLQEELLAAKRTALRKALEQAAEHAADFVLLVGRVIAPRAKCPGLLAAFVDELRGGIARGLPIYWHTAAASWPEFVPLPPEVIFVRKPTAVCNPQGGVLATLLPLERQAPRGESRHSVRPQPNSAAPRGWIIRVGTLPQPEKIHQHMEANPAAYWALAGHPRHVVAHGRQVAHWPGALQADCPSDYGPHGATLVVLRPQKPPELVPIECDTVRFARVHLLVAGPSDRPELLRQAEQKVARLRSAWPDHHILLQWVVHLKPDALVHRPWRWLSAEDFRRSLLDRYGNHRPTVWTLSVRLRPKYPAPDEDATNFASLVHRFLAQDNLWTTALEELRVALSQVAEPKLCAHILHRLRPAALGGRLLPEAFWEVSQLLDPGGSPE